MVLWKKTYKVQRSWNRIASHFGDRNHTHTYVDSLVVTSNQWILIPRLIAGLQVCISHSFEKSMNSDRSSAFSNVLTEPTQFAIYTGNIVNVVICFL